MGGGGGVARRVSLRGPSSACPCVVGGGRVSGLASRAVSAVRDTLMRTGKFEIDFRACLSQALRFSMYWVKLFGGGQSIVATRGHLRHATRYASRPLIFRTLPFRCRVQRKG